MARAERKVNDLTAEDPEMEDAIRTVLERSESEPVEWADVNDELTSGQWGRLIERGVLSSTDQGDGFVVRDRDAVREALDGDVDAGSAIGTADAADDGDEPNSSWTTYDKLAGAGALALFVGYWYQPVRDVIGSAVDLVLGPLDAFLPFYIVVLVVAMATGLYSTLLQANLMDMENIQYYQQKMQGIREREKEAKERGDEEELERIRQEQMEAAGENLGMFKEQFRPMAWIMLLTIPAFLWMYWKILQGGGSITPAERTIVLPLIGTAEWTQGVVGPIQAWILWYFLCSLGFTQIIRKALNIETAPSPGASSG